MRCCKFQNVATPSIRVLYRYYSNLERKYQNLQVLEQIKSFVAIKNSLANPSSINKKEQLFLNELHKPTTIQQFEFHLKKYLDYISALYVARKKAEESNLILNHFSSNLFYRNSKTYESAMLAAKTVLDEKTVLELWDQICYFGIEKTPLQYHCIIFVVSIHSTHQAIELFEKAISEGIVPLVITINRILNGLLKENKYQTVLQFFEKNVKQLPKETRNSITFELLIKACKYLRKEKLVLEYIALQNEENIIISETSVEEVRSFISAKEKVEKLIQKLESLKHSQVNETTQKNLQLSLLQQIKICKKQNELQKLFDAMKRTNVISISPEILKTFTLQFAEYDVKKAMNLFVTEIQLIVKLNPTEQIIKQINFLLQDLLTLYSSQQEIQEFIISQLVEFLLIHKLQLQMNLYTISILMNYLYRVKNVKQMTNLFSKAQFLFETMDLHSAKHTLEGIIKPYWLALLEHRHYETILSTYYQIAKSFFEKDLLHPSLLHYVIASHCRVKNNFESAYQVFCMAQQNWNVSFTVQTYSCLLEACSAKQIEIAKELYQQARKKQFQFTADDLTHFAAKLWSARQNNFILTLVEKEIQTKQVNVSKSSHKYMTVLSELLLVKLMRLNKREHVEMVIEWVKENGVVLQLKHKRMVMQWLLDQNQVKAATDWCKWAAQREEERGLDNLRKLQEQASHKLDQLIQSATNTP